jgi:hypothetical protein
VATALVLLVLVGHAFVVSATHFHPGRQPGAAPSYGTRVSQPDEAQNTSIANGHEQCLLCRLQRNLISDLQSSPPALCPPRAEGLSPHDSPDASARRAHLLLRQGRAPPHA